MKQVIYIALGIFLGLWLYTEYQQWRAREQMRQMLEYFPKAAEEMMRKLPTAPSKPSRPSPQPAKSPPRPSEY